VEQKQQENARPSARAPLSVNNAGIVIERAWSVGRVQYAGHFRQRIKDRGFTTADIGHVLRSGNVFGSPEYCPDFDNWKYRMRAEVADEVLEVVVALDPYEDFDATPLVILITAYWK